MMMMKAIFTPARRTTNNSLASSCAVISGSVVLLSQLVRAENQESVLPS